MTDLVLHIVTVFMGFFAIMNPVANTPIFLSLTSDEDQTTTKAIAFRALFLAFLITTTFALGGKLIFDVFGITLYALRVTGGILVFWIGLSMLQGISPHSSAKQAASSEAQHEASLSIAVSPLAMPILAGPGTIATAMNFATAGGLSEVLVTIVSFGVLCVLTYFLFIFGEHFIKAIGPSLLSVITKMMGLILAVIGMQMLIEGIHEAIISFTQ